VRGNGRKGRLARGKHVCSQYRGGKPTWDRAKVSERIHGKRERSLLRTRGRRRPPLLTTKLSRPSKTHRDPHQKGRQEIKKLGGKNTPPPRQKKSPETPTFDPKKQKKIKMTKNKACDPPKRKEGKGTRK